jgi:metal-dependent amidase/aminoacylase/carboxypeptidase family protein
VLADHSCVAEEGGGGKQILLDRGGYKDMDACIMYFCHYLHLGNYLCGVTMQVSSRRSSTAFRKHREHKRYAADGG